MGLISQLSVRTKLLGSFILVCTITGLVGVVGMMKMSQINDMLNTLYERELQGVSYAKEIAWGVAAIGRDARQSVLETDVEAMRTCKSEVDTRAKRIEELFGKLEPCFVTDEGKVLVKKAQDAFIPFLAKVAEANDLSIQGKNDEAKSTLAEARAYADQLAGHVDAMVALKEKLAETAYNDSDVAYGSARTMVISFIVGGVILGLGLGYCIARAITIPLTQAVQVLQALAAGDLTVRLNVAAKDEVGQMANALNTAVTSMHEALSDVRGVADNVASAAQQLAAASQQISTGAQEQASSLEETASSLEEITVTIKQNADNADQANQLSARSRDVAEKGGKVVGDAVSGMQEINAASKRIADIITAIDEIAFQTNLLALNAAVEAARAGEQGRGFAVVAGEVRNLAQRSAGAAKEIKGLIQDSVRKVEIGTDLVNQSGESLNEIISSVKRVTDIVSEISAASREQATGIEQVNRAVSQMDQVTQENASQTEELSGTAEGLSGQAEGLQDLVRRFKLEGQGEKRSSTTRVAATPSVDHKPKKQLTTAVVPAAKPAKRTESQGELQLVGAGATSNGAQDGSFVEF